MVSWIQRLCKSLLPTAIHRELIQVTYELAIQYQQPEIEAYLKEILAEQPVSPKATTQIGSVRNHSFFSEDGGNTSLTDQATSQSTFSHGK